MGAPNTPQLTQEQLEEDARRDKAAAAINKAILEGKGGPEAEMKALQEKEKEVPADADNAGSAQEAPKAEAAPEAKKTFPVKSGKL